MHGLSLENANKVVNDFINKCFHNNINRIIVVTGKGLRSKNTENPYVSKDLSILKYSVPEFINKTICKEILQNFLLHANCIYIYIYFFGGVNIFIEFQ